MKQIILQRLTLVNFKGIHSLDVTFQDGSNVICGENGTGKTTLFDSFLWCLFGKDSTGRSDFNVKTLGEDGKPFLKLEHSVKLVLLVDGTPVSLQRNFCEVWTKPRGMSEETLTNHKTDFYINDVKCGTKKEFDSEVAAILSEDVFRMVTNPFYFTSLKPEIQKDMLLEMAGRVDDSDVASLKPEYAQLLAQLNGKPLAQFLKEVAAKKRAIKDDLATIPASIETAQRLRPQDEDWAALATELKEKKARIAEIDAQLTDRNQAQNAEVERKLAIQKEIGSKKLSLAQRQNALRAQAQAGVSEAQQEIQGIRYKLDASKREGVSLLDALNRIGANLERKEKEIEGKREEYRAENNRQLEFPEGAFVCPTCKRPLEPEDIETKRQELEQNFNQNKSAKLKRIQEAGKQLRSELDSLIEEQKNIQTKLAENKTAQDSLAAELEAKSANIPEAVNPDTLIAQDGECIRLQNDIVELENQLTQEAAPVDVSDLREAKKVLTENVEEIAKRQAKKIQIENADKEIKSLEERKIANNQELAELEGSEFVATSFLKARDNELLSRVNGMFNLVKFNFLSEQLNGGEKLTCVCTVDGTPYPDVNNAGKINAGLDIINAICKSQGITAPIFIDNRESVNTLIPTLSQVINLCVSQDENLCLVDADGIKKVITNN